MDSTACGTIGAGHSRSGCLGGRTPPGFDRFWPSCAHRAPLRVLQLTATVGTFYLRPPCGLLPTSLQPAVARRVVSRVAPVILHHLPIRSVNCQLGCPGVWQKRHESNSHIPTGAKCACRARVWCNGPCFQGFSSGHRLSFILRHDGACGNSRKPANVIPKASGEEARNNLILQSLEKQPPAASQHFERKPRGRPPRDLAPTAIPVRSFPGS